MIDEENPNYVLKYAVCACIVTDADKLVAVSRKDNHNLIGLPGGKVDDGEDNVTALVREISEELELTLDPSDFTLCYDGYCEPGADGQDFYVFTYMYKHVVPDADFHFLNKEGAKVTTTILSGMCDDETSPFASYNRSLRAAVKRAHYWSEIEARV